MGGCSKFAQIVSIGVGIAVLMSLNRRLERGIEQYFLQRRLEFLPRREDPTRPVITAQAGSMY
jgi:hypothetical protein